MPINQKDLIDAREWDWIIWFDGGRFDYFCELYREYFEGTPRRVWNGDVGYTGDWSVRHLRQEFPDMGCFSPVPLRELDAVDYDDTKWFDVAPDNEEYDESSVEDRLAALGYLEHDQDEDPWTIHTTRVNEIVREYLDEIEGGVIRYIKPHPPFEGYEDITKGQGKVKRTVEALLSGDVTREELEDAYVQEYRKAFEGARDIIEDLDGTVVITADHGECLYEPGCNQVYHGRNFQMHDHLTHVPWLEVEGVK